MQKRGIADFNSGHLDNGPNELDDSAGDWSAIVAASNAALETSPLGWGLNFGHTGAPPVIITDGESEDASGGPDAAAAGGKKTGGGTTSGGGTTGGGTPGGTTSTAPSAPATVLQHISIHERTPNPADGATTTPT